MSTPNTIYIKPLGWYNLYSDAELISLGVVTGDQLVISNLSDSNIGITEGPEAPQFPKGLDIVKPNELYISTLKPDGIWVKCDNVDARILVEYAP